MPYLKQKYAYMLAFITGFGSIIDIAGKSAFLPQQRIYKGFAEDRANISADYNKICGDLRTAYGKATAKAAE